jgi:hypothetical protein
MGHAADLQNLRTNHTWLREELTKQLLLKDREKKLGSLPNHLARLRQSFCLNSNTRTGCWKSNTKTTKTEMLLFLNLEFFLCVCLFVLFPVCLSTTSPCWLLWFTFFFFSFFLYFVNFTIVKLANTKLHTDQGQKQHQVEQWEDEKRMETILPQKINTGFRGKWRKRTPSSRLQ